MCTRPLLNEVLFTFHVKLRGLKFTRIIRPNLWVEHSYTYKEDPPLWYAIDLPENARAPTLEILSISSGVLSPQVPVTYAPAKFFAHLGLSNHCNVRLRTYYRPAHSTLRACTKSATSLLDKRSICRLMSSPFLFSPVCRSVEQFTQQLYLSCDSPLRRRWSCPFGGDGQSHYKWKNRCGIKGSARK